jgi:hypothetical protein
VRNTDADFHRYPASGDIPERWPKGGGHTPAVSLAVLDAGPIPHEQLERFDDPDIETGLEESGNRSEDATYRLIEIDVADLEDTHNFPFDCRPTHTSEPGRRFDA